MIERAGTVPATVNTKIWYESDTCTKSYVFNRAGLPGVDLSFVRSFIRTSAVSLSFIPGLMFLLRVAFNRGASFYFCMYLHVCIFFVS